MIMAATLPFTLTSCEHEYWYDEWDYSNYYQDWYDDYDWYSDPYNYGNDALYAEAQMLRGMWYGRLLATYTDNYGKRVTADLDVEFHFDQYNANSLNGRGVEYDFYEDGTDELRFSWYIDPRTGDICILYDANQNGFKREMRLYINRNRDGFYLDKDQFYGTMYGINCDEVDEFDLRRTTYAKPNTMFESKRKAIKKDSIVKRRLY